MSQVVLVSFSQRLAWADTGEALPIVKYFDADECSTEDFNEAVVFVAGRDDMWYAGRVDDWIPAVIN
jgi:hypothetical protein